MGIGLGELLLLVLVVMLVFGSRRLPEVGRGIGKGIRNFKQAVRENTENDKP